VTDPTGLGRQLTGRGRHHRRRNLGRADRGTARTPAPLLRDQPPDHV